MPSPVVAQALRELRQLLQVLGSDASSAPLVPTPTASDISGLIEHVRLAGQQVDYRVEGEAREIDPVLGQTAYRVVQEALTNAVRYAGGSATRVVLVYGPDSLIVTVADDGNGQEHHWASTGAGLRGLQERVAIFGGELSASKAAGGGFTVRARLPWAQQT